MMRALLIGVVLAVAAVGVSAQTTSFVDVNVVRLVQGDVLPSQIVVVTDGRVTAIGSADTTPAPGVTVDGSGRYLVPGLVVLNGRLPTYNLLGWRETLLAYLAHGVTTLGVSEAEMEFLDRLIRVQEGEFGLRPVLAGGSGLGSMPGAMDPVQAAGDASRLRLPALEGDPLAALRRHALDLSGSPFRVAAIEPGASADLLLLAEDPLRDATATRRPLGVMVQGRWIPYADIARLAREYGQSRRLWHMRRVPRMERPRGPWPDDSCVGESLDDCFGGDPDCALYQTGLHLTLSDCRAASTRADRADVLDALDLLASINPIDNWLVGQRVHFALMIGGPDRAWTVAETCAAATWWCQALRGLVLHERAPGSAQARFDSAYANAPAGTPAWSSPKIPGAGDRGLHCEWADLAYLIEDTALLASYRWEPCGSNAAFEARFWWLADPLWSQEGNERRDEHISRNIRMRLWDDRRRLTGWHHAHCVSSSIHTGYARDGAPGTSEDCARGHSAIIPFGLPNSWRGAAYRYANGLIIGAKGRIVTPPDDPSARIKSWERGNTLATDRTRSQLRIGYLNGGYSFVPDTGRFRSPMQSAASDWAVTWNEGHERMLTRETWYNLEHQTTVLRRGAELQVLAAARFPTPLSSFDEIDGFLAAGRVTDRHVEVMPAEVDHRTGIIRGSATLPDGEWLASTEALGPDIRGRARHGAPAPPLVAGYGISDLVLVRPDFEPGQGGLLQAMLPSKAAAQDQRVGLYFELYGVAAGQTVELTLAHDAVAGRRSLFGRIASFIGIGRDDSDQNARLRWTERMTDVMDGIARASVALDLRTLGAGEHHITLTATAGGRTASGATDIYVRE